MNLFNSAHASETETSLYSQVPPAKGKDGRQLELQTAIITASAPDDFQFRFPCALPHDNCLGDRMSLPTLLVIPLAGASEAGSTRVRERLAPVEGEWLLTRLCKVFLAKLSDQHFAKLRANMEQSTLSMGSMCSGSEVSFVTSHVLQQVLNVGSVRQEYACEIDTKKQKFLERVVGSLPGAEDSCIFSNIEDMALRRSSCVKHLQQCSRRKVLWGSCGFSCKSFSKLYVDSGSRSDWLQTGPCACPMPNQST